jgi:hypothetical protein
MAADLRPAWPEAAARQLVTAARQAPLRDVAVTSPRLSLRDLRGRAEIIAASTSSLRAPGVGLYLRYALEATDPLDYTSRMARTTPIAVVETPEFLSATLKLLTEEERAVLVDYLAHNLAAGDLVQGTGGVRKLRWGLEERGKRGGARAMYFYHGATFRCSR